MPAHTVKHIRVAVNSTIGFRLFMAIVNPVLDLTRGNTNVN